MSREPSVMPVHKAHYGFLLCTATTVMTACCLESIITSAESLRDDTMHAQLLT